MYSDEQDDYQQEDDSEETDEEENEETPSPQDDESSEKVIKEKDSKHPVYYSKKAMREGYDFSEFSKIDQEITQWLYISEDAVSDFALASRRFCEMRDNPEEKFFFNYAWGLPCDGKIYGYVFDCAQSMYRANQYVLQLLVTNCDIRKFTFTLGFNDPVNIAIKDCLGLKNNIFHQVGFESLIGQIVIMRTHNEKTNAGKEFTKIEDIYFLDREERNLLVKMTNTMLKQSRRGKKV